MLNKIKLFKIDEEDEDILPGYLKDKSANSKPQKISNNTDDELVPPDRPRTRTA